MKKVQIKDKQTLVEVQRAYYGKGYRKAQNEKYFALFVRNLLIMILIAMLIFIYVQQTLL